MTLDEIAIFHGTDKATWHPVKGHGYTPHYAQLFERIKHDPVNILEIGVGGGESIRTWLEYFPSARVFGVDIVHGTNQWNTVGAKTDHRYTFVNGDQSCETFWRCFVVDYGSTWNVIIDDGGHSSQQIITSFQMMWPNVSPGGLYCIEDLGVSYDPYSVFRSPGWQLHMDFIKQKLDDINLKDEISELHFSRELAIFRKR